MKKIECVIKEEKLKTAIEALKLAGVPGVTVTKVEGFGRQRIVPEPILKPKVKIEIYVGSEDVDTIVKTLTLVGRSGKMGDGKIAIFDMENVIRIRTGERNQEALY